MRALGSWMIRPVSFTLQGRLAMGLSLAALVLISLTSIGIGKYLEDSSLTALEEQLNNDNEAILALIRPLPNGQLLFAESQLPSVYQRPFSGHYLQIQFGDQLIRSRSLWDEDLPRDSAAANTHEVRTITGPLQRSLLAVTRTYASRGQPLSITVATDLTSVHRHIHQLQRSLMIYGLISLGLMLLVQYLIVYRTLRPLQRARHQLHLLQQGEIGRLNAESVPDELKPLLVQLNDLLATLEQRLTRSRKGLGNLAHALKTPLAVLMQLADRPELPDSISHTLSQRTGEIRQLIDRELRRARLAGGGQPARLLDIRPEVNDLVDTLQLIYRDRHLQLQAQVAPNSGFRGDRQDFQELLGNLLDNACKWANHEVRVRLEGTQPLQLCIEDDGPGVRAERWPELLQRGKRLDESRHGSGLGLAIVKDIVDLYRGEIELQHSTLGGLKVQVRLP